MLLHFLALNDHQSFPEFPDRAGAKPFHSLFQLGDAPLLLTKLLCCSWLVHQVICTPVYHLDWLGCSFRSEIWFPPHTGRA
jgi:hypothetical protein